VSEIVKTRVSFLRMILLFQFLQENNPSQVNLAFTGVAAYHQLLQTRTADFRLKNLVNLFGAVIWRYGCSTPRTRKVAASTYFSQINRVRMNLPHPFASLLRFEFSFAR
jgi:hypothetical protein